MPLEPWPLEHKAIGKEISMNDAFFAAGKGWELGPNWLGVRCGAKTRKGSPCQNPAMKGKARCRNHGGKSTGARTAAGLAKLSALHWKHGRCTKAAKAESEASRADWTGDQVRTAGDRARGHRSGDLGQGLASAFCLAPPQ